MRVEDLISAIDCDFFTGVPDSKLRALCDYLMDRYGTDQRHHVIAANEGNSAAIAAGYHIATGRLPVVYMQNSGIGNAINPIVSLLSEKVYGIPVLFIVGWRGEPGIKDEPQHSYQGEITVPLLRAVGIEARELSAATTPADLARTMQELHPIFSDGRCAAVVVRENALEYPKRKYENGNIMLRESAIKLIIAHAGDNPIIATTGKAGRELYTLREEMGQGHERDFLTVGSMGHASSIALGIALQRPERRVWCIDGDGAAIMHMGAMAVLGAAHPRNLIHIVINNCAHESVGGMPTAAGRIDLCGIATACGYASATRVTDERELEECLRDAAREDGPLFIEAKCRIGARQGLGRPTMRPCEMKQEYSTAYFS